MSDTSLVSNSFQTFIKEATEYQSDLVVSIL